MADAGVSALVHAAHCAGFRPADADIAPFAGFPQSAARKGFDLNHEHWSAWDLNSNDADVCCMDPAVNGSYLVWGASTQVVLLTPTLTRPYTPRLNAAGPSPHPHHDRDSNSPRLGACVGSSTQTAQPWPHSDTSHHRDHDRDPTSSGVHPVWTQPYPDPEV